MAAGVNGAVTQSMAARWMGRWAVGAALGQILFGGTVRLVLAVLFGAALGGLGVWLVQRSRAPVGIQRISSFPRLTRRTAPRRTPRTAATRTNAPQLMTGVGTTPRADRTTAHLDTRGVRARLDRSPGSATRRRYSPRARPQAAAAAGRPSVITGQPGSGGPRRAAG